CHLHAGATDRHATPNQHAAPGPTDCHLHTMVRRLLRLPGEPGADAADALACAICHAHAGLGLGRLATRGLRMKRGRLRSL
ncbi:MAG TPA: crossover junction endodeoxyribonuclease RuvC, partial [Burkholderiales bacterium]